jgi:hypothetical protein
LQNNIGLILSFNVSQNEGEIWNNLEAIKVEPGVYHVVFTTQFTDGSEFIETKEICLVLITISCDKE